MKKGLYISFIALFFAACTNKTRDYNAILMPEAGTKVKLGSEFLFDVQFADGKVDSVVYLVDSSVVARKVDTAAVKVSTAGMAMGSHLLTSKIYRSGTSDEITSNVVVVAAKAPARYTYKIVNIYPHDTSSFTEGLEFKDGILYESDGLTGESSLRKADLKTGRIIQKTDVPAPYFAEGIAVIGNKVIQLTWQDKVGFIYDKQTLKKLSEFPYNVAQEGWGLLFNGRQLLTTDGTNTIYFLNKDTFQKEGSLDVYDDNGPVDQLNEIEMIEGKIYANIWQKAVIVVIDPNTGAVDATIDMSGLYPKETQHPEKNVLNGIAWDAAGKRMFVTGKNWDKLFEIRVLK